MKSTVLFFGERAEWFRDIMPLRGDEFITTVWSVTDFELLYSNDAIDCDMIHVIMDISEEISIQYFSRFLSLRSKGKVAVAYPILPLVVERELRDKAESNLCKIEGLFSSVIPIDMELMRTYCGNCMVHEAISHLKLAAASCIEYLDGQVAASDNQFRGGFTDTAKGIIESQLKKVYQEQEEKQRVQAEKMKAEFKRSIDYISMLIEKEEYDWAVDSLPKRMDKPYYLSDENSRMIGPTLNELFPVLDRLKSNQPVYKAYRVRIDGVRERLELVLRKLNLR